MVQVRQMLIRYGVSAVVVLALIVRTDLAPSLAAQSNTGQQITVRVRVEQDPSLPVSLPVQHDVAQLLETAGFSVVSESASTYDAALEILVKGEPLTGQYYAAAGYRYSGAKVSGTLLLESSKTSSTKTFTGTVEPPSYIFENAYRTLQSAPFEEALRHSTHYADPPRTLGSCAVVRIGGEGACRSRVLDELCLLLSIHA